MPNRFDYVKYDAKSVEKQNTMKAKFQELESLTHQLKDGRAKSLVLTHLEEAYMWVGKAIRDEQVADPGRGGEEQPERTNG